MKRLSVLILLITVIASVSALNSENFQNIYAYYTIEKSAVIIGTSFSPNDSFCLFYGDHGGCGDFDQNGDFSFNFNWSCGADEEDTMRMEVYQGHYGPKIAEYTGNKTPNIPDNTVIMVPIGPGSLAIQPRFVSSNQILCQDPPSQLPQNTTQATGQVIVLGTCGLSFPNGTNVNYGSLTPNTISPETKLNMTNSGTINATLAVSGTNWLDTVNNPVMLVNRTHYNVTSGTYSEKTSLQTFDQVVTSNFTSATLLQTFWQLNTILLNPSFTGTITQTMDFTVSC